MQEVTTNSMDESAPANLKINILECLLAFMGSAVAGTLWWAGRIHVKLPCTDDGHGCDAVAESRYAHITVGPLHDIPVALLGLLTYLALLGLSVTKIASESRKTVWTLLGGQWAVSAFGCGYSWYLQYVAKVHVGAYCPWCRASAFIMTALFLTISYELIRFSRKDTGAGAAQKVAGKDS